MSLVLFYQDEGNQVPKKKKRDKSKRQVGDIGQKIERVNQMSHFQQVGKVKN